MLHGVIALFGPVAVEPVAVRPVAVRPVAKRSLVIFRRSRSVNLIHVSSVRDRLSSVMCPHDGWRFSGISTC
jgi:hypothetical protein